MGTYPITIRAIAGFSSGFIATGGDLKAALYGGVSGAAFGAVGASKLSDPTKIAAHGAVGGISSKIQGGKFGVGFVSSAFAKFTSGKISGMDSLDKVGRGLATAIAGGTASLIGGGKFSNGAARAALAYVVNETSWESDSKFETAMEHLSGHPRVALALTQIKSLLEQGHNLREAMVYIESSGDLGEYKEMFESLAAYYDSSPRDFSSPDQLNNSANSVMRHAYRDSLLKGMTAEYFLVQGVADQVTDFFLKKLLIVNRVPSDVADLITQGKSLEGNMEALRELTQ